MADLMRLSQPMSSPLLLLLLRKSTRPTPTPTPTPISPLQTLLCPRRSLSTTPQWRRRIPSGTQSGRDPRLMQQVAEYPNFLLPGTLVAPPIWRYPRKPAQFFQMLWQHIRARAETAMQLIGFKITTMPQAFRSRPLFKARRSAAIPTAKALHARMSEALAAGDRAALRAVCTPELAQSLGAVIEARGPKVRAEWEVLSYDKPWYYPRLADWRIAMLPRPGQKSQTITMQAVVSISSVQRIARYDLTRGGAGQKIEGSERVRNLLEHVVIQADVNPTTYEHGTWKVWGTVPESTLEKFLQQKADFSATS